MHPTGSTNFVMFDRVVSRFVGKTPQLLLESAAEPGVPPSDFQAFLDKPSLFKVEIVEGNVAQHWQHFPVRRLTADDAIINSFINNQPRPEASSEHVDSLMNANYGSSVDGSTPTSKAASSSASAYVVHDRGDVYCKRAVDLGIDLPPAAEHHATGRSVCECIVEDDVAIICSQSNASDRSSCKRILDVDVDLPSINGRASTTVGTSGVVTASSKPVDKLAKPVVVKTEPKDRKPKDKKPRDEK